MKFFQRLRIRIARKRLSKALDKCTEADLKRAAALNDWIRSNHLFPGDRVILTFDGEHSDVVITDLQARYLKEREQIFNDLKNET